MSDPTAVAVVNVPECSLVEVRDWNAQEAADFNPTTWNWWKSEWQAWVPGAVLGGLAALGFLFFLSWLLALLCRTHFWKWELDMLPSSYPDEEKQRKTKRRERFIGWMTLIFWLGVVGLSTWGLVEAVTRTNTAVSDFWGIVVSGRQTVANATTLGGNALSDFGAVSEGLGVIAGGGAAEAAEAAAATAPNATDMGGGDSVSLGPVFIRSVPAVTSQVADQAAQLKSELNALLQEANEALSTVKVEGVQRLDDFIGDYQGPTQAVENTWRYVALAVFFGLLILAATAGTLLGLGGRWARTAAFFVLMLWLLTSLLMLLGAGLLGTGYHLTSGTCLYGEAWGQREAAARSSNATRADLALRYYLGSDDTAQMTAEDIASQVYGLDLAAMNAALASVQPVLGWLDTSDGQDMVAQLPEGSSARTWVEGMPTALESGTDSLDAFVTAIGRDAFRPVYDEAKSFVCCDMADLLYNLWIAWTADGCAALVLAFLLSMRIRLLVVYS